MNQFGKSLNDECGPGQSRRMNISRRTSFLLDAFLFKLRGFGVLDLSAMSASRSSAPASMFKNSFVALRREVL